MILDNGRVWARHLRRLVAVDGGVETHLFGIDFVRLSGTGTFSITRDGVEVVTGENPIVVGSHLGVYRTTTGGLSVEWRDRRVVTGDFGLLQYPLCVGLAWARTVLEREDIP